MPSLDLFSIGAWAIYDHLFRMSRYPKNGDTVTLDMSVENLQKFYYGDCSANVAAAASRLGLKTGLGMVVGEDFITTGYQDHLVGLGVDLQGVEIRPGECSGHNYLFFDGEGNGFCISHQGLASDQSGWRAPEEVIRRSKYVVLNEMFSTYTLEAAEIARSAGAQVAINGMVATSGPLAIEFITRADILFIAQSELSDLLALLQLRHPQQLLEMGLKQVFATQGKQGSRIYTSSGVETVPIVPAEKIVDTTGAGDSYCAGTLAGLIKGMTPTQAAQVGATVSSFIIEAWGCQTNLPTWEQVMNRYQTHFQQEIHW